jgi:cell division protein ZapA
MKSLEVQIMGQSYLLSCPEGAQARLQSAVERVHQAMCKIRDAGKVKARERIAVLAALNLAFEWPDPVAAIANHTANTTTPLTPRPNAPPAVATEPDAAWDTLLSRLDQALSADEHLI